MRATVKSSVLVVAAALLALAAAGVGVPGAGGQSLTQRVDNPGLTADGPSTLRVPPRAGTDVRLASGALREMVARLRSGKATAGDRAASVNGVRVEVLHSLAPAKLSTLLAHLGGSNLRPIDERTAEAVVPVGRLEALEASDGIQFVRPPLVVNGPPDRLSAFHFSAPDFPWQTGSVAGQHVTKTNAASWHAVGQRGNGVKVGIIDGFSSAHWNQALASGDLPNPAGTFCVQDGSACDIWAAGRSSTHGVGVGEIIYDMAPGAQLYLAYAGPTAADLQAAVNYFASQGVRIISRSQSAWYDGPGDGTGPIANVIENAVSRGIMWFNSAGNSGGTSDNPGAYWRGTWSDPNGDTWLEFRPGDLSMGFYCGFALGVRWSDWGTLRTDYDIYVYDDPSLTVLEAKGENNQPGGAPPIEYFMDPANPSLRAGTCDSDNDVDFMAIKLYNANGGTAGDTLEFMMNSAEIEYWQNPHSATQPASDTASAGGVSVGAIEPWNGTTAASYSAQGPANDGRIKPDLSAGTCVSTTVDNCFNGTSGATPVVAGAAALYIGANPTASPAQVKIFLLSAVVDRGTAGPDNVYGVGELVLPSLSAPPPPPPSPPPPQPQPQPVVRTVSMSMAGPRAQFQRERTFQVSWRSVANAGRYDVQYRSAPFRGIYGGFRSWRSNTPVTSVSFTGQSGRSYCFRVRANQSSGFTSNWTNPRCTAIPVSVLNRTMRGRGGWKYYRAGGRFLNAFGLSYRRGASLGLTGVRATRLSLVVTKCPRCGSVNVYWNKRLLASARLTAASLQYKQIIEVGSFPGQQKGTIRIVITSRGKPVAIEGLGIFS